MYGLYRMLCCCIMVDFVTDGTASHWKCQEAPMVMSRPVRRVNFFFCGEDKPTPLPPQALLLLRRLLLALQDLRYMKTPINRLFENHLIFSGREICGRFGSQSRSCRARMSSRVVSPSVWKTCRAFIYGREIMATVGLSEVLSAFGSVWRCPQKRGVGGTFERLLVLIHSTFSLFFSPCFFLS